MKQIFLLYHDLASSAYPNEKSNLATKGTVVDAGKFAAQIKYLAENGYKTISIKEYFEYVKQGNYFPERKIIITFDDGHHSNYHIALPILLQYDFRAAFFIIANRINQPYYLTENQIREMVNKGMEIGSHGLTHQYLPTIDSHKVWHEVSESKKILESIIHPPVDFFAYPGGHYKKNILNLLKLSGYKGACSCLQGTNSVKTNPFLLRRIEIRRNISLHAFKYMFSPGNIAFYQAIDFLKRLFRKTVGINSYSYIRSKMYKFYLFKR